MKTHTTAASPTDCNDQPRLFQDLGARQIVADFSGGTLSSDGGVLFLRPIDQRLGLSRSLAGCFADTRAQRFVDHTLPQLLAQRLYGLALGYEDLNDHDRLRYDPLLAAAGDKRDPLGADRLLPHHRGAALAGSATLNRLELSNHQKTRAHRLAGKNFGVIWTAPWRVDITDAVKPKRNKLEIKVTNVWANRLIGDEQQPADCEWNKGSQGFGGPLKAFPDWFVKGQPRPSSGRFTFTTWNYFNKNSPLIPSGLLGPVTLGESGTLN